MVTVSDQGRHDMSSSLVPIKTRRVGARCTLNMSRAETPSRWCSVVVRRRVPAQVSSSSLDHGERGILNLSRAQASSRWCGVVVRRGDASSDVVLVTSPWFKITRSFAKNPRIA
ncbi:hypothetical protein TNCV_375461 [Trichonephila clavipes]|nr:hypothetical protein TNCV_375461 [Trichonephila clavipes]